MDETKYNKAFSIKKIQARSTRRDKNQLALERAHEIRKFEIELYWKRTAYIWTLIAAMFAGYCVLASKQTLSGTNNTDLYLIFIASTGFVFSYSWFLINKGSKFWQENWEFHIDRLEDNVTGPLYKTVLQRDESMKYKQDWKNNILAPQAFSVSKINQFIAIYTMFTWVVLMFIPKTTFINSIFVILFVFSVIAVLHKNSISEIKDNAEPMKVKSINRKTEF